MRGFKGQVYALLVGIDDYPAPIEPLNACMADVQRVRSWLEQTFAPGQLQLRQLLNREALREAVIAGFRQHLGQAGPGDLVWFYFAGHGARQRSAREFVERGLSSEAWDETLVCYDSRSPEGLDLADKEIAFLLAECAGKGARIITVLDCCHSGGAVRHGKLLTRISALKRRVRQRGKPRSIETYLNGFRDNRVQVPEPPFIALSACRRNEEALEVGDRGLFTHCLLRVLAQMGPDPKISRLYLGTKYLLKQTLKESSFQQQPKMLAYGGLSTQRSLISNQVLVSPFLQYLYRDGGASVINWGIFDGAIPGQLCELLDAKQEVLGEGEVVQCGLLHAEVKCQQDLSGLPTAVRILPRPIKGLRLGVRGEALREEISLLLEAEGVEQVEVIPEEPTGYTIWQVGQLLVLWDPLQYTRLILANREEEDWYTQLFDALFKLIRWQNGLHAAGQWLSTQAIDFHFADYHSYQVLAGQSLHIEVSRQSPASPLLIRAANHSDRDCYFSLLYFTREYGIQSFPAVPAPADGQTTTLFGESYSQRAYLPPHYQRNTDHIRLLVTWEDPEIHLLDQDDLHTAISKKTVRGQRRGRLQLIDAWGFLDLKLEISLKS